MRRARHNHMLVIGILLWTSLLSGCLQPSAGGTATDGSLPADGKALLTADESEDQEQHDEGRSYGAQARVGPYAYDPSQTARWDGIQRSEPYGDIVMTVQSPDVVRTGERATWVIAVTHRGPTDAEPFVYNGNGCGWQATIRGAAGLVYDDAAHGCDANYEEVELRPGETMTRWWTWDGHAWDAEAEERVAPEPGSYRFEFVVRAGVPGAQDDDAGPRVIEYRVIS